jgi:hypothetical protein
MSCDAAIRPFRPVNETEVRCDRDAAHVEHAGVIRDYAYPGSATTLTWFEGDRRTFHGEWPGGCHDCFLPTGHAGKHAR